MKISSSKARSTRDAEAVRRSWRALASWLNSVRRHRRPLLLLLVGVAAGLLAATALARIHGPDTAPVSRSHAATAIPGPPVRSVTGQHIQPTTLNIPSIGVTSTLVDLELNPDRTLHPPDDFQTAGWFAAGPAPGDAGGPPAVIAGHVDSQTGPAIFFRLHELTDGNDIAITGVDGTVRHFTVYRTVDYAKSDFPANEVYAPTRRAEVRLITCTGDFDSHADSYISNLVVYAAQTGE